MKQKAPPFYRVVPFAMFIHKLFSYVNSISTYEDKSKMVINTLIVRKTFGCLSSGISFWIHNVFVSVLM